MVLWNTSKSTIETKFDGQPYIFAPGERKKIFDPVIVDHLIYKLEDYGLVSMADDFNSEVEKKAKIQGLRNRRKMLDFRVRNFRTMNKEREAMKLTVEPPSDLIIESVNEIEVVDKELEGILQAEYAKVDSYLKTKEMEDTEEKIDDLEESVESSGSNIGIRKRGRPKKNAVSSSRN